VLITALLLAQAGFGMADFPSPEEFLSFTFLRDDQRREAKISGSLETPTEWSVASFIRILDACGAKQIAVSSKTRSYMILTSKSGSNDLKIARCVKASTSVRFSAEIKRIAHGTATFYDQPFRELWTD